MVSLVLELSSITPSIKPCGRALSKMIWIKALCLIEHACLSKQDFDPYWIAQCPPIWLDGVMVDSSRLCCLLIVMAPCSYEN